MARPVRRIFKKMTLPLVASLMALPAFAGPGNWFDASSNFATLDASASEVRLRVQYPQLRGGNCGIGIGLNGFSSEERYYNKLLAQLEVKSDYLTDQGTYELAPVSVSRDGILYAFNYFTQYYMTYVTISTKDGSTFGEVFDSLLTFYDVHAITSAVTCQQLDDAKQN